MSLADHAREELALLGEDPEFAQSIVSTIGAFEAYGHSGFSHEIAVDTLTRLLRGENLTPLTNDPSEWEDRRATNNSAPLWQNKRNSEAFSENHGFSYYLLSEDTYDENLNLVRTFHASAPAEPQENTDEFYAETVAMVEDAEWLQEELPLEGDKHITINLNVG